MVAPAGAPEPSENVRVWPASGSVAVAVKMSVMSSKSTVLLPIALSTGGWFTIVSVIVKTIASKSSSAGTPLSVTRTVARRAAAVASS